MAAGSLALRVYLLEREVSQHTRPAACMLSMHIGLTALDFSAAQSHLLGAVWMGKEDEAGEAVPC